MRGDKNLACMTGWVLSSLIAEGVAGSLVTGLGLDVPEMGTLFAICVLAGLVSALCWRFRWGGVVLTGVIVGTGWLLWRDGRIVQQGLFLLRRVLTLCSNAYGIGVPDVIKQTNDPGSLWLIVASLAAVPAVGISRTVCRRGGLAAALLAGVLPMGLCFLVTDTVPGSEYLYLWMLGLTLLLLTNGVRVADAGQGVTLTAMAAVPVALALALLFWLVPREGYDKHPEAVQQRIVNWIRDMPQLWEDTTEQVSSALSGAVQPSEVNLRTLGPRVRRTYPVMEVTAPESGTLYLRGQDYDLYDGMGWTANRRRSENFSTAGMTSSGNVTVSTRRVRDVIYLPYYPGSGVTLIGGQLDNSQDLKEYSFSQWRLPGDWRQQVREAESAEPDSGIIALTLSMESVQDERWYLTLPNDTRQWAVELLKTILNDEKTATSVADTIASYVKNSARYDLDTPRMTGYSDFARWFLEESETGYCVHFATAATVLLRAAGIEARYVEGYMTDAQAGSEVTVTEDQAHAWVEYYEPIFNIWIVLDPTPPDLTAQSSSTSPETQPEEQATLPTETESSLPTDAPGETQPYDEQDSGTGSGEDGNMPPKSSGLPGWTAWVLAAAAAVTAVLWQRKLRLACHRRIQKSGDTNARALARWREIEGLCRLLKTACPEDLEQLAQKAKYSSHTITAQELQTMDKAIWDCRQKLQTAPWYKKMVYQYIFAML